MSSPVILVTGGYDHKIRYWDAASGVCTRSVSFGESQINCLQISLDKTLLAAGGNPMINLYDINSNDDRPLVSYEGHSGNVTGLGFHRDQRWLYSCSEDGSVRIWDPRTNTTSRRFETQSAVNTVVLHPTEAELISGDADGNLKVWDLAADKMREEFNPAPDFPIRSLSMVCELPMVGWAGWVGGVPCHRSAWGRPRREESSPSVPLDTSAVWSVLLSVMLSVSCRPLSRTPVTNALTPHVVSGRHDDGGRIPSRTALRLLYLPGKGTFPAVVVLSSLLCACSVRLTGAPAGVPARAPLLIRVTLATVPVFLIDPLSAEDRTDEGVPSA